MNHYIIAKFIFYLKIQLLPLIRNNPNLRVCGVFTHLPFSHYYPLCCSISPWKISLLNLTLLGKAGQHLVRIACLGLCTSVISCLVPVISFF